MTETETQREIQRQRHRERAGQGENIKGRPEIIPSGLIVFK